MIHRLSFLLFLQLCCVLEAMETTDEALCKQSWTRFGPLCRHYVIGRKEKPDTVYEILRSHVNAEATILDLGSGTGISTRQLCKNGFKHVIGVDRDPLMIKEAQAANNDKCSIKYIQSDVSNGLPFPNEEFDVVTASSAFHWFANPTSIKEVARILKPNGYYFVIGAKGGKEMKDDQLKANIKRILKDAGVPPRPDKYPISTLEALEGVGFKIVVKAQVPFAYEYTKQEYLDRIQSKSSWNLVKESQRDTILKKIDQYLDTIVNENGKVRQEGNITVILAQKVSTTQTE